VGKTTTKTKRRPAAVSKKRPQPAWLCDMQRQLPALGDEPPAPERTRAAPPRLLDRHEVCAITGTSYPTIWTWMRAKKFPRSRVVGGRTMWLTTEIEAWIAALPVRKLKGDEAAA
jgi:predicted DNA-binding transcriptional regulator AlpA